MPTSSTAASRVMSIGLGLGAGLLTGILSYVFYNYWKRDDMPRKWRRIGTLDQINLFPIKSCGPLKLSAENEIFCGILGLSCKGIKDRVLMLVNEKYEMITARVYTKMILISTKIEDEGQLVVTAEGMEPLHIDFNTLLDEAPGTDIHTSVWGCSLDTKLCGEEYDKWFSRCILKKDSGLHLVYYPHNESVRCVNARLVNEPFITKEDSGAFGDATSYMLMNLASIDDLNTRLTNSVDPLQFRGNFHLKMDVDEPYAEDNFQWVRIGNEAVFRKVAPCTRCIFPNINVKTGERNPHGEPLKELKKYRLLKNHGVSPALGIHLGLRRAGSIKANDVIYVNVE